MQIRDLKSENHHFRENNIEISEINLKLSQDLELLKKNIEIIQDQNAEVKEVKNEILLFLNRSMKK